MVANKAKAGNALWQKSNTRSLSASQSSESVPAAGTRQLNLISWNEGEPKYDIRDWSPDGTRMGKGISLSHDELAILKGILEDMEL